MGRQAWFGRAVALGVLVSMGVPIACVGESGPKESSENAPRPVAPGDAEAEGGSHDGDEPGGNGGNSGAPDVSGSSGDTGVCGSSGDPGIGGSSGDPGVGGSSGDDGAAGDGSLECVADGPIGNPDARRAVPFVSREADAEAESGSACTPLPNGLECRGTATVSIAAGKPVLVFDDGPSLEWQDQGGTFVAVPAIDFGDTVWVEYSREEQLVCPVCGAYYEVSIAIRREEEGELLWMGQEGSFLSELDPELVEMLLGVPARRELACRSDAYQVNCHEVVRELFDHVLETDPEQRIPHATPTRVVTPEGEFEVMWASSEEADTPGDCFDGREPAHDRGFALSRIVPDLVPEGCPDSPPEELHRCPTPGLSCSYSDDPSGPCPEACTGECRDVYHCGGASGGWTWWYMEERPTGCSAPDPECPEERPENYDPCSEEDLRCRYEEELCYCTACPWTEEPLTQSPTWYCTAPINDDCPKVLPREGEACDLPSGTECDGYTECFGCSIHNVAPFAICTDGVWEGAHWDCGE